MKKICSVLLALLMLISFSACESKEEREIRHAQEMADLARSQADKAMQEYYDFNRRVDRINDLYNRLN